ncbi:unnamed protein product, partial [Staurois parvus]
MDTDRWHCWGYTDHQGTLIISALMISEHVPSEGCQLPALLSSVSRGHVQCALMISV